MFMNVTLIAEKLNKDVPEEIFCGYIEGKSWIEGNPLLSRNHRQPNRIYSSLGIHPAICSSETQGRYYVCEVIHDSGNEGTESR